MSSPYAYYKWYGIPQERSQRQEDTGSPELSTSMIAMPDAPSAVLIAHLYRTPGSSCPLPFRLNSQDGFAVGYDLRVRPYRHHTGRYVRAASW